VVGISLHGGPVRGTWRGDFFTRDFERQVKEGSGDGASLSLGACEGNLEGGLLCWGLIKICKRRLWKWNIVLYVGAS
jgi:hypothetical protein